MMSEEDIREWRDREKERVSAICNPYHRRRASDLLNTLNAVLEED